MSRTIRISDDAFRFFKSMKYAPSHSIADVISNFIDWFYKYKKGYQILKKYFDTIEDKDKVKIIQQLKIIGIN